jgi:hypothetical protein
MAQIYDDVLQAVTDSQQEQELSIIKISEPISAAGLSNATRTSDVSNDAFERPTAASLEADLSHYKVGYSDILFYLFTDLY